MKKIITIGVIGAIGFWVVAGCKKNNSSSNGKSDRVRIITGTTESRSFLYDNAARIVRINSSAGYSTRFTYLPAEIVVQDYFSNDQPDPQGKYSFTLQNGRITSGRKYLSTGAIVHEYVYRYDAQQRLATLSFNIKDFAGNDAENHNYQLTYDGEDNVQQITFKRSLAGVNADSSAVTITWYADKSFITWKNLGFDLFGKVPVGHQLQGQVAIPFSLAEKIFPTKKAVKAVDTKKYQWNPGTGSWGLQSSNNDTHPETDYQYDESGRLKKYMNYTIEWDDQ